MEKKLQEIKERIKLAAQKAKRDPKEIKLVAVSKTKPASLVEKGIKSGIEILGENYIQEARDKYETLSAYDVSWHFIGHLQSNKAKYAVRIFDLIHSVDSLKLAKQINKEAAKRAKIQDVLLQVNVGAEYSKSGVSVEETMTLIKETAPLESIKVKGLMAIPPFYNEPEKVRPFFQSLRKLRDQARADLPEITEDLKELSMGMTGDFETAIEEGATLVRVGTAIFGARG